MGEAKDGGILEDPRGISTALNALYFSSCLAKIPTHLGRVLFEQPFRSSTWRRVIGKSTEIKPRGRVVWLHGASLGEARVLCSLITRLKCARGDLFPVLSTGSLRTSRVIIGEYPDLAIFESPLDFSWGVKRVLRQLNPCLIVLGEMELWPNLLLEAKRRKIPVAVVNGRLSEAQYERSLAIRRSLLRTGIGKSLSPSYSLGNLTPGLDAIHWWGVQTKEAARRISRLAGNSATVVSVTGSIKFDIANQEDRACHIESLRRLIGYAQGDSVLVGGSTHPPEEQFLLQAFLGLKKRFPRLRLVLAPRFDHRFGSIIAPLRRGSLTYRKFSEIAVPLESPPDVLLVDTLGHLRDIWGLATFAFIGGSLVDGIGGQSMIEPAALGIPCFFGPYVGNVKEIAEALVRSGGALTVNDPETLRASLGHLLDHCAERQRMGASAARFTRSRKGATQKTLEALLSLLPAPCQ